MEGAESAEPYSGAATTGTSAGPQEALGGREGDAIGDPPDGPTTEVLIPVLVPVFDASDPAGRGGGVGDGDGDCVSDAADEEASPPGGTDRAPDCDPAAGERSLPSFPFRASDCVQRVCLNPTPLPPPRFTI